MATGERVACPMANGFEDSEFSNEMTEALEAAAEQAEAPITAH